MRSRFIIYFLVMGLLFLSFCSIYFVFFFFFFFSSRRRHTRFDCDWSSDVCSSDLGELNKGSAAERLSVILICFGYLTLGSVLSVVAGERKFDYTNDAVLWMRSEERRVGKECRSRWSP